MNKKTDYQPLVENIKKELVRIDHKKPNIIIKLIVFEKFFKGVILLLLSLTVFPVFSDQSVHYLRLTARHFHILSNARFITRLFTRIEDAPDRKLLIYSMFFLIWGVFELLESIGLARRRRWAEYLIVIFTGLFIPVETYTILARFTIEKLILFLFNVFLVYYLIQSRKLFKTNN